MLFTAQLLQLFCMFENTHKKILGKYTNKNIFFRNSLRVVWAEV